MGEFSKKLKEIESKRRKVLKKLEKLEDNEIVKQFKELELLNKNLLSEKYGIERQARLEEYEECDHKLVVTKIVYGRNNVPHKRYGCMKCGLDDSLLDEYDLIPAYTRDMNEFIRRHKISWDYAIRNKNTDIICDIDLARALYAKIKEEFPDADDERTLIIFTTALDSIRKLDISQKDKEERAKVLGLYPSFKRWSEESVIERF